MRAVADIDVEGAEEAVQLNQPAPPAPHSPPTHRHSPALTGTQIWPGAGSKGAESGKTGIFEEEKVLDIWVKLEPPVLLIVI